MWTCCPLCFRSIVGVGIFSIRVFEETIENVIWFCVCVCWRVNYTAKKIWIFISRITLKILQLVYYCWKFRIFCLFVCLSLFIWHIFRLNLVLVSIAADRSSSFAKYSNFLNRFTTSQETNTWKERSKQCSKCNRSP